MQARAVFTSRCAPLGSLGAHAFNRTRNPGPLLFCIRQTPVSNFPGVWHLPENWRVHLGRERHAVDGLRRHQGVDLHAVGPHTRRAPMGPCSGDRYCRHVLPLRPVERREAVEVPAAEERKAGEGEPGRLGWMTLNQGQRVPCSSPSNPSQEGLGVDHLGGGWETGGPAVCATSHPGSRNSPAEPIRCPVSGSATA